MIDHVETPSSKHPQLVNTTHHVANNPMLMNHEYHYTKSWFDVEMDETVTLLLRKLEEMNKMDVDELCHSEIESFKNIYKTFYYIKNM